MHGTAHSCDASVHRSILQGSKWMDASSCSSMMCAHQVSDASAWPVESSLWVPLQPTRTHRQQVWVRNGRYQNTLHMCASSSPVICSISICQLHNAVGCMSQEVLDCDIAGCASWQGPARWQAGCAQGLECSGAAYGQPTATYHVARGAGGT